MIARVATVAAATSLAILSGCQYISSPIQVVIKGKSFGISSHGYPYSTESLTGSGVEQIEIRDVSGFTGIRLVGPFEVVASAGSADSVAVIIDDNLQAYIDTRITDDGTLLIRPSGSFSTDIMPRIEVSAPVLNASSLSGPGFIRLTGISGHSFAGAVSGSGEMELMGSASSMALSVSGSGDIIATDIASTSVEMAISGSGSITASGSTTSLDIGLSGSGDIHATELHADRVGIGISGSGDVNVHAASNLEVGISGSGDVRYRGEPGVSTSVSGSGSVAALPE